MTNALVSVIMVGGRREHEMKKTTDQRAVVRYMMDNAAGGLEIRVRSADSGQVYAIRKIARGRWTCSCPDYMYRGGKPEVSKTTGRTRPHICKHMKALFNAREGVEIVSVDLNAKVDAAARQVAEWVSN